MTPIPETQASLILRIQDLGDIDAWEMFSKIYRPVIYRLARGSGLQHADAEDLTQQVLTSVSQAIPQYKTQRHVKFRSWLTRIVRNAVINSLTRGKPTQRGVGGSDFVELLAAVADDDSGFEPQIELEYQRQVYRYAAARIRAEIQPQTWQAFVLTVVMGESTESAAESLKMSIGSIHAARSRVMRRLRAVVQSIGEEVL